MVEGKEAFIAGEKDDSEFCFVPLQSCLTIIMKAIELGISGSFSAVRNCTRRLSLLVDD